MPAVQIEGCHPPFQAHGFTEDDAIQQGDENDFGAQQRRGHRDVPLSQSRKSEELPDEECDGGGEGLIALRQHFRKIGAYPERQIKKGHGHICGEIYLPDRGAARQSALRAKSGNGVDEGAPQNRR